MPTNYKAELVGVLGYPVAENPTCVMQEAAFAALGLQWRYLTIEVEPQALPDALRGVRAFGMRGINLTIPHKVAVMPLLDEVTPDAAMIGAVNSVRRVGDRLVGENTNGKGFLRGVPVEAWQYQLGTYSALEWVLERHKEREPRDLTIREKFNTYRFADYKEQVIDLLRRVCTVSVETIKIIEQMPK